MEFFKCLEMTELKQMVSFHLFVEEIMETRTHSLHHKSFELYLKIKQNTRTFIQFAGTLLEEREGKGKRV